MQIWSLKHMPAALQRLTLLRWGTCEPWRCESILRECFCWVAGKPGEECWGRVERLATCSSGLSWVTCCPVGQVQKVFSLPPRKVLHHLFVQGSGTICENPGQPYASKFKQLQQRFLPEVRRTLLRFCTWSSHCCQTTSNPSVPLRYWSSCRLALLFSIPPLSLWNLLDYRLMNRTFLQFLLITQDYRYRIFLQTLKFHIPFLLILWRFP